PPAGPASGLLPHQRSRSSVPLTRRRLFSAGRETTNMSPATPAVPLESSQTMRNSASLLAYGTMLSSSTSLVLERQPARSLVLQRASSSTRLAVLYSMPQPPRRLSRNSERPLVAVPR